MITDYECFWPDKTPRCEVLTCFTDSTHVLQLDNNEICLCDFHIGKYALIAISLQHNAGVNACVHKIGQSWQAEQARLRYEGE
jgi:hypothetical protein